MEHTVNDEKLVIEIANLLDEYKAEDTIALNVSEMSNWTDYFIICTVRSQTHLRSLFDRLKEYLDKHNVKPLNSQKKTGDQTWVLIDCGTFIIHLMEKEKREFYELEKLWFRSSSLL